MIGMRGAGGQCHEPGDDVPDDGPDEASADDVDVDGLGVDELVGDGLSDACSEEEGGDEVEEGSPENGLKGRQDAGGDDGGNGVRSVVKAVEEVEDERNCNEDVDKVESLHGVLSRF